MQLLSIKTIITVVWVSTLILVGIAVNVHSFAGWVLLSAVAVGPPLVMMSRWNSPRQTMSETIQKALR